MLRSPRPEGLTTWRNSATTKEIGLASNEAAGCRNASRTRGEAELTGPARGDPNLLNFSTSRANWNSLDRQSVRFPAVCIGAGRTLRYAKARLPPDPLTSLNRQKPWHPIGLDTAASRDLRKNGSRKGPSLRNAGSCDRTDLPIPQITLAALRINRHHARAEDQFAGPDRRALVMPVPGQDQGRGLRLKSRRACCPHDLVCTSEPRRLGSPKP